MSNWRVIRSVFAGELRFRLEDVNTPEMVERGFDLFTKHNNYIGFESPDALRKDLEEKLAALNKPHMYIEPARVVEIPKRKK